MTIIYTAQGGTTYKLVYTTISRNVWSRKIGKYFTTITQCILYRNDLVIGFSTAQRCFQDKEDQRYAFILVTKKISNLIPNPLSRKMIWDLLFNNIN